MRPRWSIVPALAVATMARAQDVRINEVSPAHAQGGTDWVELYNAGTEDVDLEGYTLVVDGTYQRLAGPMPMPARTFQLLWCDRRTVKGPLHLDLKLARTGGTLLLVAPDRTTVLDAFTWPALPDGVSMARMPDGARSHGFFDHPTPGASNSGAFARARCLHAPVIAARNGQITLSSSEDATIHYTLDGSDPTPSSPGYAAPFSLPDTAVIRARAFAGDAVPSPCAAFSPRLEEQAMALIVDPHDLWDPAVGLLAENGAANFARTGPEWTRVAWLQQDTDLAVPIGMAISGSGSRSQPKKNFKVFARDRFNSKERFRLPDGTGNDEFILRADATPDAFLRNLFMEAVVACSGARVDVQASRVRPLYLNGRYWGLYRVLPAKNATWLEQRAQVEAVDLADGPGGRMLHGKPAHHERMVNALLRQAPEDTLAQLIDLGSLIDLACFDLWTGRADHDLNVRCWRPRVTGGRWRWILYDEDLWAPPTEGTVERMCSASALETPYLSQLLADRALCDRLLARLSALLATTLEPAAASALADSIYAAYEPLMQADHERWYRQMAVPSPDESRARLDTHIRQRTTPLLEQLAHHTGRPLRTVTVSVEPIDGGTVQVEELPLKQGTVAIRTFGGIALGFTAVPAAGMEFAGWKETEGSGTTVPIDPSRTKKLTARFRPAGLSRQHGLQQRGE